jgi:hypothetical protein
LPDIFLTRLVLDWILSWYEFRIVRLPLSFAGIWKPIFSPSPVPLARLSFGGESSLFSEALHRLTLRSVLSYSASNSILTGTNVIYLDSQIPLQSPNPGVTHDSIVTFSHCVSTDIPARSAHCYFFFLISFFFKKKKKRKKEKSKE